MTMVADGRSICRVLGMFKRRHAVAAVMMLAALPAAAEDTSSAGGEERQTPADARKLLDASPFATATPGQTAPPGPETPTGLELGLLHWYPIESRCTFVDPSQSVDPQAVEEIKDDPDRKPYIFVTMTEMGGGTTTQLERGYVMANGIVRELEKGKTAPNRNGNVVTVWRSASEPRINVNTVITGVETGDAGPRYSGSMTVFWGDKKEEVSIEGTCRS